MARSQCQAAYADKQEEHVCRGTVPWPWTLFLEGARKACESSVDSQQPTCEAAEHPANDLFVFHAWCCDERLSFTVQQQSPEARLLRSSTSRLATLELSDGGPEAAGTTTCNELPQCWPSPQWPFGYVILLGTCLGIFLICYGMVLLFTRRRSSTPSASRTELDAGLEMGELQDVARLEHLRAMDGLIEERDVRALSVVQRTGSRLLQSLGSWRASKPTAVMKDSMPGATPGGDVPGTNASTSSGAGASASARQTVRFQEQEEKPPLDPETVKEAEAAERWAQEEEKMAQRKTIHAGDMEEEVILWLEALTGEKREDRPFGAWLRDGRVLCRAANVIRPKIVRKINEDVEGKPFKQMENITSFIGACRKLGVMEKDVFSTVDLYEAKNLQVVRQCIMQLGSVVRQTAPDFKGPYLGVKQNANIKDEKRKQVEAGKILAGGLRQD